MKRLVGYRFRTLDDIKKRIEELTHKKVGIIAESQTEQVEETDFMIDVEFELFDIHAIFYLKDNANRYYITEVY